MSIASLLNFTSRLVIRAFDTAKEREGGLAPPSNTIKVMYNPETVSFSFSNEIESVGLDKQLEDFGVNSGYDKFALHLVFDKVHPTRYAMLANPASFALLQMASDKFIRKSVQKFINFCEGKGPGAPRYLSINWASCGKHGIMFCRLSRVNVQYTLFDKRGNPTRANLDLTFSIDDFNP